MKSKNHSETGHKRRISCREREIIESLVVGATADEVARELTISPHTVRAHIRNIYQKLDIANRLELLLWLQATRGSEHSNDRRPTTGEG